MMVYVSAFWVLHKYFSTPNEYTLFVDLVTSCILANPGHGKHLTPLCNRTQGIKILEEIYEA